MADEHLNLPPGTTLDGKWCVEGLLGAGGMGTVFRARHVRNGREVALKVLHPTVGADRGARERFLHEGYAANRVGHEGTVQVLDDGVAREGAYLVMELLRGSPIDRLAEANNEVLPLATVLTLMDAALSILATAHDKGIIHRDFKPENLFLTEDRELKMLDFGLARVKETSGGMRLTATGVPMGTPAFMPPEQALAHWDEVDARSDVYAVGASMWTLLTGALVHEARSAPELLVKASTQQAASILTVCPSLPPRIAAVIDRSLRFDRMQRFADARAMKLALSQAVHESGMAFAPLRNVPVSGAGIFDPSENPTTPKVIAGAVPPTATVAPITSDSQSGRRKTRLQAVTLVAIALGLGALVGLFAYRQMSDQSTTTTAEANTTSAPGNATPPTTPPTVAPAPATATAEPVVSEVPSATTSASVAPVATAAPTAEPKVTPTVVKKPPTAVPTAPPTVAKPCDPMKQYCKR